VNLQTFKTKAAELLFELNLVKQDKKESYFTHEHHYPMYLAHTLSEQQIKKFILEHPEATISAIDIGCGEGQISFELAKHFQEVIAIEPSITALKIAELRAEGRDKNIRWVNGFAEVELRLLKLKNPAFFFSSVVLSHIDDNTVKEICAGLDEAAKQGSVLYLGENWGRESHKKLWHTRTPKWWAEALPKWSLRFYPLIVEGREDRYKGIYGVKEEKL
jgi:SAM-dependent methyltransferase